MENWKILIEDVMKNHGETWEDVEASTMTEEEMLTEFYSGFGGPEGCPFTVWTKNRVYFPVVYDGAEWASSVSRNPNGKPTTHVGSW